MIDEFEQSLLPAAFEIPGKSIALNVVRTSDDFSRDLAIHERPHQQGGRIRDMGGVPRTTSVTLVFIPPNVIAQVLELKEAFSRGESGLFVHPLFGAYTAHVERFEVDGEAQDRDYLIARATFFEDIEDAENVLRADLVDFTDASAVEASIEGLRTELDDAGLESDAPDAAAGQLEEWEGATDTNRRSIALQLATVSNTLATAADELELATDVARYPVIVAFTNLQSDLAKYARRLMTTQPRLTTYTVRVRQPLMTVLRGLYGASGALERFDRVLALNDIPNPAAVAAGTTLTVEVP